MIKVDKGGRGGGPPKVNKQSELLRGRYDKRGGGGGGGKNVWILVDVNKERSLTFLICHSSDPFNRSDLFVFFSILKTVVPVHIEQLTYFR